MRDKTDFAHSMLANVPFPCFAMDVMRNIEEMDENIINQFKAWFPNKTIEPIEINEIAIFGGLMNCISWHVH